MYEELLIRLYLKWLVMLQNNVIRTLAHVGFDDHL